MIVYFTLFSAEIQSIFEKYPNDFPLLFHKVYCIIGYYIMIAVLQHKDHMPPLFTRRRYPC